MEKIIYWNNMELEIKDFEHSHVNGGRLGKVWVTDRKTGRIFMVKGCSQFHFEPFSEKIAYIVGKNLGIDVLEYDILPAKYFKEVLPITNIFCPYVSICEKIDRKGYSITSVAEIKRARNALLQPGEKKITNREVMYELLPQSYIDTMFLFDAIIGNIDRHYGNVHLLRSTNGDIIGAPILDNGASLLANSPLMLAYITGYKVGEVFNKAFTTEVNHDKQIIATTTLNNISFNIAAKTMDILDEIKPTLELMSKTRALIIKKFLVYRIHKYLGMIKYNDNAKYFASIKSKKKRKVEREVSGQ